MQATRDAEIRETIREMTLSPCNTGEQNAAILVDSLRNASTWAEGEVAQLAFYRVEWERYGKLLEAAEQRGDEPLAKAIRGLRGTLAGMCGLDRPEVA